MSQTNNRRPVRARTLTPEQRRRILERRRKQKQKKQLMILAAVAAVVVIAVTLALMLPLGNRSAEKIPVDAPTAEPEGVEAGAIIDGETDGAEDPEMGEVDEPGAYVSYDTETEIENADVGSPAAAIDFTPTGGVFTYDEAYVAAALGATTGPEITPDLSNVDPAKADRWPEVSEGYMPVLYSANTTENVIAITVDDCFQAENLQQIVQCALDNGGKLTIFPIGDNLARNNVAAAVKWAWESGMEIENHTYNHVGLYHYDDERMAKEIWMQNMQLNQVLGVNYKEHFFRPKGGDERTCQRVHAYVNQMGFSAVAIWTQSGSSDSINSLMNNLGPGNIYLFHTTDKDLTKLLQFIPYATSQGYRLITMNEMFGLPDNETSELTATVDPPALQAFRVIPTTLKKTSYIRAAAIVQKRLIELGWLEGDADGVFGQSSYVATGYFQVAADLKADGKAGGTTQVALFSDDAPKATKENLAKVKEKIKK